MSVLEAIVYIALGANILQSVAVIVAAVVIIRRGVVETHSTWRH